MTIEKVNQIKEQISKLQEELIKLEKEAKDELLEKDDFIEALFEYLQFKGYPLELYNTYGTDIGMVDTFGKAKIHVVYNWGYTDIIGLTDEEFDSLNCKIVDFYKDNINE